MHVPSAAASQHHLGVEGLDIDLPHGGVGVNRQEELPPDLARVPIAHDGVYPARRRIAGDCEDGARVVGLHVDAPRVAVGEVLLDVQRRPFVAVRADINIGVDQYSLRRPT